MCICTDCELVKVGGKGEDNEVIRITPSLDVMSAYMQNTEASAAKEQLNFLCSVQFLFFYHH